MKLTQDDYSFLSFRSVAECIFRATEMLRTSFPGIFDCNSFICGWSKNSILLRPPRNLPNIIFMKFDNYWLSQRTKLLQTTVVGRRFTAVTLILHYPDYTCFSWRKNGQRCGICKKYNSGLILFYSDSSHDHEKRSHFIYYVTLFQWQFHERIPVENMSTWQASQTIASSAVLPQKRS